MQRNVYIYYNLDVVTFIVHRPSIGTAKLIKNLTMKGR